MSNPTPPDPDTHVVRVTREPRPDGGAVYHVTVDAGSEAVIAAGCLIEGVTPGYLVASSVHIRLAALGQALANLDATQPPETVN